MHDAQPVDDDDVAGAGNEPEAFVAVIARPVQPCQESIAVVNTLPVGEVAEEHEAARLHVEDVEDLGLVRDVLLEAESFAWLLQEDGIAQRARRFHRIRLVLEQESELLLEGREAADGGTVKGRSQLAREDLLQLSFGLFEDRNGRIGPKRIDQRRPRRRRVGTHSRDSPSSRLIHSTIVIKKSRVPAARLDVASTWSDISQG